VGQAFGRIGCLINGCCFGKPGHGPLDVTYHAPPHDSVLQIQAQQGLLSPESLVREGGVVQCLPVAPVQLYLSLANAAIVGILLWVLLRRRPQWAPGRYFALFLVLYAIARGSLEFLRGDYLHLHRGLTIAQVICLGLLPVGLVLFWLRRTRRAPAA
jgi:phosphatidylglycerol:prolipoprotein diacylglycerol transferase